MSPHMGFWVSLSCIQFMNAKSGFLVFFVCFHYEARLLCWRICNEAFLFNYQSLLLHSYKLLTVRSISSSHCSSWWWSRWWSLLNGMSSTCRSRLYPVIFTLSAMLPRRRSSSFMSTRASCSSSPSSMACQCSESKETTMRVDGSHVLPCA